MFDIVVDYPDSRPAVQDVKDCLAHTNLHRKFVAGFKQAIGERLLHAGTDHCMLSLSAASAYGCMYRHDCFVEIYSPFVCISTCCT